MLAIYKTVDDALVSLDKIEKGCWVNLINPTEQEILQVTEATGLDYDFLKYPLDDEEIPRVETEEEEQVMIIIHAPIITNEEVIYDTVPLGIILNDDYLVTASLRDLQLYEEIRSSRVKGMATFKKTRFIFNILQRKTNLFLRYLRDISRRTEELDKEMHHSTKNTELVNLLSLQKSLVYFSTSLRYNAKVMNRLMRGKTVKMYEEDEDILEDVVVENTQAIEMADNYTTITGNTMSAFAALTSNNLSEAMKFLTSVTIILTVPMLISGFWGMNVGMPLAGNPLAFLIIVAVSALICLGAVAALKKRDML